MERPFELPELITLSGKKLSEDMSFEDLVLSGGGNTCGNGSGSAGNTCGNGSGDANDQVGVP